ncbi:NADAR family protein [Chondrinema litorale]|uniref:NADAR family protein n=1 Tax=Chondrinema litorale TaxID=2994555 RepID=UPI0025428DFD|nr:NADAR family protein [Chondrinema litorale]UZS00009.1 NADAR family protein [Chondrinema litorale]
MENLKYEDLPEVFTNKILETLIKMEEEQSPEWREIFRKMTSQQSIQYVNYKSEKQRTDAREKEANMTQAEKEKKQLSILKWGATRWNEEMSLEAEYEYLERHKQAFYKGESIGVSATVMKWIKYMNPNEVFYFFSSVSSSFSTFYRSSFIAENKEFNSVVQYIMYKKAGLFLDKSLQMQIIKTSDPQKAYKMGRRISNYNRITWHNMGLGNQLRFSNKQKFKQNKELKQLLFGTKGKTIVLSDPRDKLWGIGLSENDARGQTRETWNGKNLFGDILTRLRIELMGEY